MTTPARNIQGEAALTPQGRAGLALIWLQEIKGTLTVIHFFMLTHQHFLPWFMLTCKYLAVENMLLVARISVSKITATKGVWSDELLLNLESPSVVLRQ